MTVIYANPRFRILSSTIKIVRKEIIETFQMSTVRIGEHYILINERPSEHSEFQMAFGSIRNNNNIKISWQKRSPELKNIDNVQVYPVNHSLFFNWSLS